MIKKLLAMALCICMIFSFSSCIVIEVGGGNDGPDEPSTKNEIRDITYSMTGNYDLKEREDGKYEFKDYELGVGVNFPTDLEYSNDVITGALLLGDGKNSFMTVRGVTDEVHNVDVYTSYDWLLSSFFEDYFMSDFAALFGETGELYDYEEVDVDGTTSVVAKANAKIRSDHYELDAYATFHSSSYVNGNTGFVVKFCVRPSGTKSSGIWGRDGIDTYACERKIFFGDSSKNKWTNDHRYEMSGAYSLDRDGDNWKFSDDTKRVGLKFPDNLEVSNTLISDAVLVSDQNNGYVVARNMTSEYFDYELNNEGFMMYVFENYLLDDFEVLYDSVMEEGKLLFKYYTDSNILCTAEARVRGENFDINVRTDLLGVQVKSGVWTYVVLTRYSPYGALGYEEVRDEVRAVYMTPNKG